MLTEKILAQPTIEMRLLDSADKLKQLLSDEEITTLERLQISEVLDSVISQRWFANCGGCGGCRICRACGGCRICRACVACGGCRICRPDLRPSACRPCIPGSTGTVLYVIEVTDDVEFGC